MAAYRSQSTSVMELGHLVNHDNPNRRQNTERLGQHPHTNQTRAAPQHETHFYSPTSASAEHRARTTSTSSATSSIPNSSPNRTKASPITLPSIHNLVHTAEEMQSGPPNRYQASTNRPAAFSSHVLDSKAYSRPHERQHSMERKNDASLDPLASMRKHRISPSTEKAALSVARTAQMGLRPSPSSPRTQEKSDGSYPRIPMDQAVHATSSIPPHMPHRPMPVNAESATSYPTSTSHIPRSNSLDSSDSSSVYPSAGSASVAASVHSPDLERGSSNLQWQHHHYIAPPATGAYGNQLTDRYTCATCNKPFSRPSSLRIHSHSHTGEKPFRCPHPDCGKAFSVRSNMKRHERGCHGGAPTGVRKT